LQCQPTSMEASHQQSQQQQFQQQQFQQQPAQLPFQGTPLRKEAPISQQPVPVYQSQPVATSYQGLT
jgi:hypothetical protein